MTTAPSQRAATTWRVLDLIRWATEYFTTHQIENARREVEWLLGRVLSLERVDLYVQFERLASAAELAAFKHLIKRRLAGEPFQYLLGKAPFYGRDFTVTPAVLIPRPESEVIIERLQKGPTPATVLDIGTGSGCLAVTVALLYPDAAVKAIDSSPDALAVARRNAGALGAGNIAFEKLDILNAVPEGQFDAVLCNPPYLAASEVTSLPREIREHEPLDALTDHADGLTFYHRLADIGPRLLTTGGRQLVEIGGHPQAEPVATIFAAAGATCQVYHDLQADARVVEAAWS